MIFNWGSGSTILGPSINLDWNTIGRITTTSRYLLPTTTTPLPGNLTLNQFIQTVLVGITGLPETLVRPEWQVKPPIHPNIPVNWLAFGLRVNVPSPYSAVFMTSNGNDTKSQRQYQIEIGCSFYGPLALDLAMQLTDGLQITQNLEVLRSANMGFVSAGPLNSIPDLINESWVNRITMSVFLNWQVDRTYAILNLVKANGIIHAEASGTEFEQDWETPDPVDD